MFVSSVWMTRGLYCVCKASRNWEAERTQERALAAFFRKKKSDCRLILDFLEECWLKRSKEWKIERSKDRSIKTKTSKWKVGTVRVMKGSKDRKIEESKYRKIERSKDRKIKSWIHQRKRKEKENEVTENKSRTCCAQMMLKWWYWRHRSRRELVLEVLRKYEFWRWFGHLGRTLQPSMTSSHSRQHCVQCNIDRVDQCAYVSDNHIFRAMEECPNEGCWRQVVEWTERERERPLARALLLFGLRWCGLFHPDVKWEPLKCANNDKK